MPYHSRATGKLLPGRYSAQGSLYFLTWCTHHRTEILFGAPIRQTICAAFACLESSGDGTLLAATVMPDHVHLLLELGSRLTVSQVVGKVKAFARRAHPSLQWQINFFEHRLRAISAAEAFAFYIFMNPYVAGLCRLEDTWPGWVRSTQIQWTFENQLLEGRFPQPECLVEAKRFAETLPAGSG